MTEDSMDPRVEVALARYEIIAPAARQDMTGAERGCILEDLSGRAHDYPGGSRKFHRRTLERWAFAYLRSSEEGRLGKLQALFPHPRCDKGKGRVVTPEVIEQAVRLRREDPSRSTGTILELLSNPPVKEATLAYHLRVRDCTRKVLKAEGRAYPRYEHQERNDMWQGDFSAGLWLPDPSVPGKARRSHLHVFLDDHSRYIPHGEFYFRENLPCLEDCFRKAVLKGGVPSRVYWDQGAVYKARQIRLLAARLGTQVIFATPYSPEGKGKVERFFGVLKSRFYPEAAKSGLTTLLDLNQFFWAWLESCYYDRVHEETRETPRARWEAAAGKVRFISPEKIPEMFLWEDERPVDKTGTFSLGGNRYPVPEEMVGKTIRVLYDPFELSRVRVFYRERFLGAFEPYEMVSRTIQRALSHKKRSEDRSARSSSVEFRGRLVRSWRQEVTSAMIRLDGGVPGDYLTSEEFQKILSASLERDLTEGERMTAEEFFLDASPWGREEALCALTLAVSKKGRERHLRYYLEALRDARGQKGGC